MWPNSQETLDLVRFAEGIFNDEFVLNFQIRSVISIPVFAFPNLISKICWVLLPILDEPVSNLCKIVYSRLISDLFSTPTVQLYRVYLFCVCGRVIAVTGGK